MIGCWHFADATLHLSTKPHPTGYAPGGGGVPGMPPKSYSFAPSRGVHANKACVYGCSGDSKSDFFLQTQRFDLRTSPRLFHILPRLLPDHG